MRNVHEVRGRESVRRWRLRLVASLVLLGVIAVWWFGPTYIPGLSPEDAYGAIDALFSGLAFAGVIFAIFLQREELMLQRRELAETRRQFERQATAAEEAHEALEKQRLAQLLHAATAAAIERAAVARSQFEVRRNDRQQHHDYRRDVEQTRRAVEGLFTRTLDELEVDGVTRTDWGIGREPPPIW